MQYSSGTVQYTNGGAVFIASAGVDWTDVKTEIDSAKMVWVKIRGSSLVYEVASITTPAANAGHTPASRWEANIVGVIGDPTDSFGNYILHWNFTPNIGLPIPNSGDMDVQAIMGRAFAILDATWVGGGPGGGTGQGYELFSVSAAGDSTSAQSSFRHVCRVTLAAGAGAYTRNLILPITGRVAGDLCFVHMDFPASSNPTIAIRNATNSGTILFTWTGDGTARTPWALAVFNGTAWYLHESSFSIVAPPGVGAGGGNSYQPVTIAAAGNTTSAQTGTEHKIKAAVNAGGGAYTATITLPTAGRTAGDECRISMAFAATTDPTIQIRNATSGGSLLWTRTGDGVARGIWVTCVFDGTTWYADSDGTLS